MECWWDKLAMHSPWPERLLKAPLCRGVHLSPGLGASCPHRNDPLGITRCAQLIFACSIRGSSDKSSNDKNVMFASTEGTVSARLGRAQDAYSIPVFHAVVNLEPLHSLRQNKFHSSTNLLIISPSNVGKQH